MVLEFRWGRRFGKTMKFCGQVHFSRRVRTMTLVQIPQLRDLKNIAILVNCKTNGRRTKPRNQGPFINLSAITSSDGCQPTRQ